MEPNTDKKSDDFEEYVRKRNFEEWDQWDNATIKALIIGAFIYIIACIIYRLTN